MSPRALRIASGLAAAVILEVAVARSIIGPPTWGLVSVGLVATMILAMVFVLEDNDDE